MTDTAKNYTDAQVEQMTDEYNANPVLDTVKALAAEFGKSVPSVRGKLSNLGIYKPQVKATSTKTVVRKDELVGQLESIFGIEVPSLVKATKADLEALVSKVLVMKEGLVAFQIEEALEDTAFAEGEG